MSFDCDDGYFVRNGILANLPPEDFRALRPHLKRVQIKARSVLQDANKRVEYVHFIEQGLISRLSGSSACWIETAMVGRFGFTGVAIVLGSKLASQRSVVRLPGTALRISAEELSRLLQSRPGIRAEMLQYVQSLITQNTQSVLCAAKHDLDQRLARWLLLAHDRMQTEMLMVTHDLLASILGVRRAGITHALQRLEAAGALKKARGAVHLTNRSALEAKACQCYPIVRDAYARWASQKCNDRPGGARGRARFAATACQA